MPHDTDFPRKSKAADDSGADEGNPLTLEDLPDVYHDPVTYDADPFWTVLAICLMVGIWVGIFWMILA